MNALSYAADAPKNTGFDKYGKPLTGAGLGGAGSSDLKGSGAPAVAQGNSLGASVTVQPLPPAANVPPDRNWMCPEGYYCVVANAGFLPTCLYGAPPSVAAYNPPAETARDCNALAQLCRQTPRTMTGNFYNTYCKS